MAASINVEQWQKGLSEHGTTFLKVIIILWLVAILFLVLYIDNPWVLAGIFLYEALP